MVMIPKDQYMALRKKGVSQEDAIAQLTSKEEQPQGWAGVKIPEIPHFTREEMGKASPVGAIGMFAGNVGAGLGNIAGGLGNIALHPLDTASTIGKVGAGTLDIARGQDTENKEFAKKALGSVIDKYTSVDAFTRALAEDPTAIVGDIATVVSGGAGVVSKGSQIAKMGKISKFSEFREFGMAEEAAKAAESARKLSKLQYAAKDVSKAAFKYDPYAQVPIFGAKVLGKTLGGTAGFAKKSGLYLLAQKSGLNPETIETITKSPQMFEKAQQGGITREGFGERLHGVLEGKIQDLGETGVQYEPIRNSGVIIENPIAKVEDRLFKKGIKAKDGVLDFSSSNIGAKTDRTAIQGAYDIMKETPAAASANDILNLRQKLDGVVHWSAQTSKKGEEIVKGVIRKTVDDVAKEGIHGLKAVDEAYSPKIAELKDLQKEWFTKTPSGDIQIKPSAVSSIANLYKKGREDKLARLEQYMPGIGKEVKALAALEDTLNVQKVGAYTRGAGTGIGTIAGAMAGGPAGALAGVAYGLVADILTSPTVIVPILKAYGKTKIALKGVIDSAINKIGLGEKLNQAEKNVVKESIKTKEAEEIVKNRKSTTDVPPTTPPTPPAPPSGTTTPPANGIPPVTPPTTNPPIPTTKKPIQSTQKPFNVDLKTKTLEGPQVDFEGKITNAIEDKAGGKLATGYLRDKNLREQLANAERKRINLSNKQTGPKAGKDTVNIKKELDAITKGIKPTTKESALDKGIDIAESTMSLVGKKFNSLKSLTSAIGKIPVGVMPVQNEDGTWSLTLVPRIGGLFGKGKKLGLFGGEKAKIKPKTGWVKGADGKMRFEIDDSRAKISNKAIEKLNANAEMYNKGTGMFGEIGDVIEHTDLYKNYPKLKDVPLQLRIDDSLGTKSNGEYQPKTKGDGDNFGKFEEIIINANNIDEAKSLILHEIQHAIQEREGFAKGGGVEYGEKGAYNKYKSLAGEVESRNVQSRMGLSKEQRGIKPPESTEDVPRNKQIVRMNNEGSSMSLPEKSLIDEAKKYKSAEEFVNSQSLYHGTPNELEGGMLKFGAGKQLKKGGYMGGHFLTDTPEIADAFSFGGKVYQASGEIKKNVLDVNANKKLFENYIGKEYVSDGENIRFTKQDFEYMFPEGKADWATINIDLVKQLVKKQGKIGIAIPEYAGGKHGITYQIFEDNIPVYTKSQLTDIWNKAHNK